ncbi:hypothetical protein ACFQER_15455 [Halomicroarcula sp. GCM10025894]|uniref:DUF7286 family protein n=1 Tax=Halomicroarcula sp. GCM10025894 TaxID=3252673 RepID=UPI00360BF543
MSKKRPKTISFNLDERARIPFAMIGVLLLITSTTAVTVLNQREDPETEINVGAAMERGQSTSEATLRQSALTAFRDSARAPVTEAGTGTPVSDGVEPPSLDSGDEGYEDAVFKRYIKLRIYLTMQSQLENQSQELSSNTTVSARCPRSKTARAASGPLSTGSNSTPDTTTTTSRTGLSRSPSIASRPPSNATGRYSANRPSRSR